MPTDDENRPQVAAAWLEEKLSDYSAAGIASGVHRLVKSGEIGQGSYLPTVRALAARMHVSPGTVSSAWSILRKQRVIEGTGRQGTWVLDRGRSLGPSRYEAVDKHWSKSTLDLTRAAPDPALLPDLMIAMQQAPSDPMLNSYVRQPITSSLERVVQTEWPWKAERSMAVNGGFDGLLLILSAVVVPGDYVAVADPSAARILDILERIGARVVPVAMDDQGPEPESLKRAMDRQPVAFLYEPRASSTLGISLSATRRDDLAKILSDSEISIVEDDGLGDLASAEYCGLGPVFPERTVLVRSYSKSHGPDLRIAVVGGASGPVTRANDLRQFRDGWTSRLTQNALAWMLGDPVVRQQVLDARGEYRRRRESLIRRFDEGGVSIRATDGLSINIPVRNEQSALLVLASHGIAASGASVNSIRSLPPALRIGIGKELDDPDRLVEVCILASKAP